MSAFDADVLIYAAGDNHPDRNRINGLLGRTDHDHVGSVILLTELFTKPIRTQADSREIDDLTAVTSRLTLLPVDVHTARLSVTLGARYNLKAMDAIHLATAVTAGADQFVTNNRKDFPKSIIEIDIVYPDELPNS